MSTDVTLEVTGCSWPWFIVGLELREVVHQPFRCVLRCRTGHADAPNDAATIDKMLCADATLTLPPDRSGAQRVVTGIVDSVRRSYGEWILELVPKGLPLLESRDYRLHLDLDAVTIAKSVFEAAGCTVRVGVSGKPPKRPQRVRAFERGVDFASRILAHDGILWFTDAADSNVVHFVDAADGFPAHPSSFDAGEIAGFRTAELHDEVVEQVRLRRRVRTSKVTLRDWDFEKTNLDLTTSKSLGAGPPLERYEYRAGFVDKTVGAALALARLEAHRRDHAVLTGTTFCTTLVPGQVVDLAAHDAALHGKWLLTAVELLMGDEEGFAPRGLRARFEAVPAAEGHRPTPTKTLRLPGIQTQTVTGAGGEEIHPDEHGRIKTKHRWDRWSKNDDTSSAWERVMQPPMPGSMLVPRVGWEVGVAFWAESADDPFVIGRLDNGKARPQSSLPGKAVVSSFGSSTTPGGGSGNMVQFSDTAGSEGMHLNASSAYSERTANDKVASVAAACSTTIGGNRTFVVGTGHMVAVGSSQSITIAGSRTENATSNINVQAGSEAIAVGGARIFTVQGDQQVTCNLLGRVVGAARMLTCVESFSLKVVGALGVSVGASMDQTSGVAHDITVAGYCKEVVGGLKSIKAAKDYSLHVRASLTESYASASFTGTEIAETASGAMTITSNGSAEVKGANVVFKAASFTVKADGLTSDISPGSVKVTGKQNSTESGVGPEGMEYGT